MLNWGGFPGLTSLRRQLSLISKSVWYMESIDSIESSFLFHLSQSQGPLSFIPCLCPVNSSTSRVTLTYMADIQKKKNPSILPITSVWLVKKKVTCLPTNLIDSRIRSRILLAQERPFLLLEGHSLRGRLVPEGDLRHLAWWSHCCLQAYILGLTV